MYIYIFHIYICFVYIYMYICIYQLYEYHISTVYIYIFMAPPKTGNAKKWVNSGNSTAPVLIFLRDAVRSTSWGMVHGGFMGKPNGRNFQVRRLFAFSNGLICFIMIL